MASKAEATEAATAAPLWRRVVRAWSPARIARALFRVGAHSGAAGRELPLDGLRALACAWVVALHGMLFLPITITTADNAAVYSTAFYDTGYRVVFNGTFGVDIFFIISGYLIMSILRRELQGMSFREECKGRREKRAKQRRAAGQEEEEGGGRVEGRGVKPCRNRRKEEGDEGRRAG